MDINGIITMVTEFFSSIPWENVIGAFKNSIAGINWDSLEKLFAGIDFSNGALQTAIDAFVGFFETLFGTVA
ncbi:MAG: hypothetical protein E7536_09680 [Ruminococcaceae bacterium]|nr:hypothetical protein [Oscillospiraceae bacterium]